MSVPRQHADFEAYAVAVPGAVGISDGIAISGAERESDTRADRLAEVSDAVRLGARD